MANAKREKLSEDQWKRWFNDDETSGSAAPAATRREPKANAAQKEKNTASLEPKAITAQERQLAGMRSASMPPPPYEPKAKKEKNTASVGMMSAKMPINVVKKLKMDHEGKIKHSEGNRPHTMVWMSVLKNAVIHAEAKLQMRHTYDEKIIETALEQVKKEIEMFERNGPENEHSHQMAQMAMHVILDFLGGDVLPSAPTTELERQCQRNIDDVQKALLGPDNLPWNTC